MYSRRILTILPAVLLLGFSKQESEQANAYLVLVEEACIGAGEHGDEDLLGKPHGLIAFEERIYILDESVPAVRVYDFAGIHLQDIGGSGEGPGEYLEPQALGVNQHEGTLFVREPNIGRIHLYTSTGEFLRSIRLDVGGSIIGGFPSLLKITNDGTPYIFKLNVEVDPSSDIGYIMRRSMLQVAQDGSISDTLNVPEFDEKSYQISAYYPDGAQRIEQVPFGPEAVWNLSNSGSMIAGYSDNYRIEIHQSNMPVRYISRAIEPIPITRSERRWYEEQTRVKMERIESNWVWKGPGVPRTKPFFSSFISDRSGRLWVLRPGPGLETNQGWKETHFFDVFNEQTGEYLGEVDAPSGIRVNPEPYIVGNIFLACLDDDNGAPIVKRYTLIEP